MHEEDRGHFIDGLVALYAALNETERRVHRVDSTPIPEHERWELFDAVWEAVHQLEQAGDAPVGRSAVWSRLRRKSDHLRLWGRER